MERGYKYPHKVTVWRKSDESDLYGNTSWLTPMVVDCRFQEGGRIVSGETGVVSRAAFVVYTQSDIIRKDDWLEYGVVDSAEPTEDAYPVKQRRRTTNLRNTRTEFRYTA